MLERRGPDSSVASAVSRIADMGSGRAGGAEWIRLP
jgi:hypothetical protein